MKKSYNKPYIAVEFFQLDAAIAAACSTDNPPKLAIHHSLHSCTPLDEDATNTYVGNLCEHNVEVEGDGNDLICYHGPITDVYDVFMAS